MLFGLVKNEFSLNSHLSGQSQHCNYTWLLTKNNKTETLWWRRPGWGTASIWSGFTLNVFRSRVCFAFLDAVERNQKVLADSWKMNQDLILTSKYACLLTFMQRETSWGHEQPKKLKQIECFHMAVFSLTLSTEMELRKTQVYNLIPDLDSLCGPVNSQWGLKIPLHKVQIFCSLSLYNICLPLMFSLPSQGKCFNLLHLKDAMVVRMCARMLPLMYLEECIWETVRLQVCTHAHTSASTHMHTLPGIFQIWKCISAKKWEVIYKRL